MEEILGFEHLGECHPAIVGGIGGVIADPSVVVGEPHESGVLDPVRLVGRGREDDPFGDVQVRPELDLVVGLGQGHHGVGDGLELALSGAVVSQHVLNREFQIAECELIAERGHHLFSQGAVHAEFRQLEVEQVLLVEGVGNEVRGHDVARRFIHADSIAAVDHSGTKRDRRDMALAGGAQTHDEAPVALGQTRLIRVPDHRGIKERGRFQRVFLREIRADQESPALANRTISEHMDFNLLEPMEQELASPLVAFSELPHDAFEESLHFVLGQGRDARNDFFEAMLVRRFERPDDDAGIRRFEGDAGALDVHVVS